MKRLAFILLLFASLATADVTGIITPLSGCQTNCTLITPAIVGSSTLTTTPAANTSNDGLILIDSTSASTGNQQYSPRLRLSGQGWKTNATAASEQVDWIMEVQPSQGTTTPNSNLIISEQVNGGGFVQIMTLSSVTTGLSAGTLSPTATGVPSSGLYRPATNTLGFSTSSASAGLIDPGNHWRLGNSTAPSITSGNCGAGTNGTIAGNDQAGTITIASATTATCIVTFSTAFTTIPRSVTLQAANAAAATALSGEYVSALATTGFTVTGTLASTTWYYWVQ